MKSILASAALWPAEKIVNTLIEADPHIGQQLSTFNDKLLEISCQSPSFDFCVHILDSKVYLRGQSSEELNIASDGRISAKVSVLSSLLIAKNSSAPLSNPELEISGDAEFIHGLFNIVQSLDLRWDDLIAPIVGDVMTNSGKKIADNVSHWQSATREKLSTSVEDYLSEESKLLPTQHAVEKFDKKLNQLRLRIDRAQARAGLLSARINPSENTL